MNLKQLIKEVERIEEETKDHYYVDEKLQGIKQTVEAVDKQFGMRYLFIYKDWQKLKKLLEVK